jgi:Fe-S-cluster containining protein
MSTAARFAEFQSREAQVRENLKQAFHPEVAQLINLQLVKSQTSPDASQTVAWLRKAASTLGSAVAPLAACQSGCSACCHIPVIVLDSEAQVIANELGLALNNVPEERRNQPAPTFRGEGHACPFLIANRCSIYPIRPLACRTLYNLDIDNMLCQHREESNLVPYFDTTEFVHLAAIALARSGAAFSAELRDFFP